MSKLGGIFPDMINTPEKEKNEEYHKNFLDAIIHNSYFGHRDNAAIKKAYDYYIGKFRPADDHNHLLISESAELYPVDMIYYNSISRFVRRFKAEFLTKGIDINAKALSPSSLSRKREGIMRMETEFALLPLMQIEEEEYGAPVIDRNTPQTPFELEEKKQNYKEEGEEIYDKIIDWLSEKWRFSSLADRLLEDLFIAGRVFAKNPLCDYYVDCEWIDPLTVFIDEDTAPDGRDCQYQGRAIYVSEGRLIKDWNIPKEKLEEVAANRGKTLSIGNVSYEMVKQLDNTNHYLVIEAFWKDISYKVGIESEKNGINHYGIYDEEPEDPSLKKNLRKMKRKANKSKKLPYTVIRHCITIGGEYVYQYGTLSDMYRTTDNWQDTELPIVFYMPGWRYGQNTSMVLEILPLQILKNEAAHKIRQHFKMDKGRSFLVDMASLPENYELEDQDYVAQVLGLMPIDSTQNRFSNNFNQYQEIDRSIKNDVITGYVQIMKLCDQEMENITGITPPMLGQVKNPGISVGVNEASLQEGSMQLTSLMLGFNDFLERVFSYALNLTKTCIETYPEKYENIIGTDGVEFLLQDDERKLEDYGATVTSNATSAEDRKIIQEITGIAIQNRAIDYYDGIKVLMEKNPREAANKLRERLKEQKEEMLQQQQQAMQAEQAKAQMEQQTEMAKAQMKAQTDAMRPQADIKREEIRTAGKLEGDKLKASASAFAARAKTMSDSAKARYSSNKNKE